MKVLSKIMLCGAMLCMTTACPEPSNNGSNTSSTPDMSGMTSADMPGTPGTPGTPDMSNPMPEPEPEPDMSCVERCVAKAMECGAPIAQAALACEDDYCLEPISEAYISCLEGTSCQTLLEPDDLLRSCNKPCFDYPTCEGSSLKTCSFDGNTEIIESTSCGANQSCSGDRCVQNACVMSGASGCNSTNSPSNCCDDRQTCFGDGNGGNSCCARPDSGCDSDSDCCFNDAPSPARCIDNICVY